jgi:SAM-dependent methyltransferase
MANLIYDTLVDWYPLLDPPEEHREEAEQFGLKFAEAITGTGTTLLELGAGGGNNAVHLKGDFRCTLTDLNESMLEISRKQNPECEHLQGDMRTLRLERTFDAVLVHDAIGYMLTEEDLRAAFETAFVHTRPGGAAIISPEGFLETFSEGTWLDEGAEGDRAIKCMEWFWDPDPTDTLCKAEFAILLREGTNVRFLHDSHDCGLFAKATWVKLLAEVGYQIEIFHRDVPKEFANEVFLCRRPGA